MKLLLIAVCLALSPWAAMAQASAPAAAASAPPLTKPGPRLATPAESRDRTSPPGELRPERPVTPQISIPVGRTAAPPSKTDPRTGRAAKPLFSGKVDDAVARCEAELGARERAECRERLAHEGGKGGAPR